MVGPLTLCLETKSFACRSHNRACVVHSSLTGHRQAGFMPFMENDSALCSPLDIAPPRPNPSCGNRGGDRYIPCPPDRAYHSVPSRASYVCPKSQHKPCDRSEKSSFRKCRVYITMQPITFALSSNSILTSRSISSVTEMYFCSTKITASA